jgi:FlaA1/EpsC-like NDP-sugar epimerase
MRTGEKMFEELFHFSEEHTKTSHESIWIANPRQASMKDIAPVFKKLHDLCNTRKSQQAMDVLKQLVPEYTKTV